MFLFALAVGLQAQTWEPPPEANAPDWYGGGPNYRYLYWDGLGTYDDANEDCAGAGDASLAADTLIISLDNCAVPDNDKKFFAYVTGTGDTPLRSGILLVAEGYVVVTKSTTLDGDGSTWWVRIEGSIHPQPDAEQLKIVLPSGAAMTECWAGSRCYTHSIPTLTEWGLIILTLVMLGTMTFVFVRKRRLGQIAA
jgi:hypothetical protein